MLARPPRPDHPRMCNASSVYGMGRECPGRVPADAPVSLCRRHLLKVYKWIVEEMDLVPIEHAMTRMFDRPAPVRGPRDTPEHVVYYVRNQQRIKIGTTAFLAHRLNCLTYDEILAIEPGDVGLEKLRHQQFAAERTSRRGEWFAMSDALLSQIEAIKAHNAEFQSRIPIRRAS